MDFPIETTVGDYDKAKGQVPVTFKHNGVTHTRGVNAVLDAKARYDEEATKKRVLEVANGVKVKIEIGVLKNVDETPAAPSEPGPVPAPETPEPKGKA